MLKTILAGTVIVCASLSGAANAALVTWDITFQANNLRDVMSHEPVDSPYEPVIGSLTVTFDNEVSVEDETSGIILHSINLPMGSPLAYTYHAGFKYILIGGSEFGVNGQGAGADDFFLSLSGLTGTKPIGEYFSFYPWPEAIGFSFFSQDADLDVTITERAVPEPASWAMMIGGFSLLGATLRRRKHAIRFT